MLERAKRLMRHHANIPVALGSGCATLLHEFVALQRSIFMEAGSTKVLTAFNAAVVAITTDRGVEKGLVHVPSVNFGAVFPFSFRKLKGLRLMEGMLMQPGT